MEEQGSQQQSKKELTDKEVLLLIKGYINRFFGFIHSRFKGRSKWYLFFSILLILDTLILLSLAAIIIPSVGSTVGFYVLLILGLFLPGFFFILLAVHFVVILIYLIVRKPDLYHTILCIAVLLSTGLFLYMMDVPANIRGVIENFQIPNEAAITEGQANKLINECRVNELFTTIPGKTTIIYSSLGIGYPRVKTATLPSDSHERLVATIKERNCTEATSIEYNNKQATLEEVKSLLENCSIGYIYYSDRAVQGIEIDKTDVAYTSFIKVNGPIQTSVLAEAFKAQKTCKNLQITTR